MLLNGGTVTTVDHTFSDADSGAVQVDGGLISYTHLDAMQDTLAAADRTFRFGGRNDLITLAINTTPADKLSRLTSRDSSAEVDFRNPSQALLVNRGAGDDLIFVKQEGRGDPGFAVTIDGGAGNDLIMAPAGKSDVTLIGGVGNDLLIGGRGNPVLLGGEGDDILIGGPGNDYLDGGPGSNFLWGGPGHDTLINGIQLNNASASSAAKKFLMLFDDLKGDFYQPGCEESHGRLDWQINLTPLKGSHVKNPDNGDDWIVDLGKEISLRDKWETRLCTLRKVQVR